MVFKMKHERLWLFSHDMCDRHSDPRLRPSIAPNHFQIPQPFARSILHHQSGGQSVATTPDNASGPDASAGCECAVQYANSCGNAQPTPPLPDIYPTFTPNREADRQNVGILHFVKSSRPTVMPIRAQILTGSIDDTPQPR